MKPNNRKQVVVGCIFAILAIGIHVVIVEQSQYGGLFSQAIDEFRQWRHGIPDIWWTLNIIPAMFGVLIGGNPHQGSDTAFFLGLSIQWFSIGFLIALLFLKLIAFAHQQPPNRSLKPTE